MAKQGCPKPKMGVRFPPDLPKYQFYIRADFYLRICLHIAKFKAKFIKIVLCYRNWDKTINSKLGQVESINVPATKATSTLSDIPKSPNRGSSKLEDTIVKIIDLQGEINRDIDKLLDLKKKS